MMSRVRKRPSCPDQGRDTRRGQLPERMVALVRRLIQPASHSGSGQSESRGQKPQAMVPLV
jgi:hypothetical protein